MKITKLYASTDRDRTYGVFYSILIPRINSMNDSFFFLLIVFSDCNLSLKAKIMPQFKHHN